MATLHNNTSIYLRYSKRWTPVILEDIKAYLPLAVDVAVVDTGLEGHLEVNIIQFVNVRGGGRSVKKSKQSKRLRVYINYQFQKLE